MTKIHKIHIREIGTKKTFHELIAPFASKKGTVLLLSGGEQDSARYNILAAEPWLEISSKGTKTTITEEGKINEISGDPFDYLQIIITSLSDSYSTIALENEKYKDLPVSAGLFGYLSYDLKDHIEEISRTTVDDLMLPDLYMISPKLIVVEDKVSGRIHAFVIELESTNDDYTERLFTLLTEAEHSTYHSGNFSITPDNSSEYFESDFNRNEYENSVSDIIDYIKQGDIYQVNMSQRFSTNFHGDSYSLFVELFQENPAPFFAYINCGDHQIVSTSPERFILQEGSRVEARPIKGTRPRGKTEKEDEKLKKELTSSPKDDAELSMIVDLLRNDIGKVCKGGSVKVLEHKTLVTYTNVHHLVSTIEGYLEEDMKSIDLLKATFPGGSITGCPKIRSMEIIDEKEPFRRHIYTGSIGYIGFNNRMDLSIVIRTATITRGKIFFSAGGGIVYDSNPADEYDETLHKGQSLMKILNRHVSLKNKSLTTEPGSMYCWSNGKFINEEKALIPAMSKGYQYGKGVFETLKVENGQIEYIKKHLERLEKGCRIVLGMEIEELDWQGISSLLIHRNGLQDTTAVLKIIISEGKSGLFANQNITVTCRKYQKRLAILERGGLKLGIYPHKRESFLADFKTMNYLFYLKAGEWAKANGFDEAVILNADGSVSETNTGNIIIVQDQAVIMPESPHRLTGIMENIMCNNYAQKGYKIIRQKFYPEKLLQGIKGTFVTNSLIGKVPVTSVDLYSSN